MRGTPYPTLDELLRGARATVAARPDDLRLRDIGTSRAGRPLWLLSAGHGPRQVLTVAGAHANEPVGGATSLRLARRLARDPSVLGRGDGGLDCTWHFLLCLDPDGARLAEGWMTANPSDVPNASDVPNGVGTVDPMSTLDAVDPVSTLDAVDARNASDTAYGRTNGAPPGAGPSSRAVRPAPAPPLMGSYYRGFYRPAFAAQPEFPPVAEDPRAPMPESEALLRLIDELRPVVQFSLHGVEVGGTFLQLTRAVPGAPAAYRRIAADLGVPLEHRPFDGMGWLVEGPGVLVLPDGSPAEERDPSGFVSRATWLHAMRHGTVSAVVEAPSWSVAGVGDPRPVAEPRRELADISELLLGRIKQLESVVGELDPSPPATPDELAHFTAARELMDIGSGVVDTWSAARLATTVGNAASLGIAARRIPLRAAAMMSQALGGAPALDALVAGWARELERTFDARWVPVADQTALQARTMLVLARALM
ncbi:M14 family zinc carboxypeptidase [Streptomyces sp. NBC_01176]|uniref:M14 family zinc carboxypeptidase n=1 Tax=Streptomyces sp. NBC_01176 TaxID=2903760 RepID=UPI00386415F8|nr:M14 family zinc carboxypeptidase [Streptomyces sp. NBC_01176]